MLDLLRSIAAPILADNEEAYPNLTMRFGAEEGRIRGVHFLHRRGHQVLRTTDRGRLLRATLAHLDGFLPEPAGLLRLRASVVAADGDAVLVSHAIGGALDTVDRRLSGRGWQRLDMAFADIDPVAQIVAMPSPRLTFDLAEIDRRYPNRETMPKPGTVFRIRAIVVSGGREHDEPRSPGRVLTTLATLVAGETRPTRGRDLEALRDARIPIRYVGDHPERQLLALLSDLRKR